MIPAPNTKTVALSKKFKDKLFYLFHNLLLFKKIKPNLGVLLLTLQTIQLIVLTLNQQNPFLDHYFFAVIVENIDVIQLYPIVDRYFDTNAKIVLNIVLFAFVSCISLSLVILSNRKDYSQNVGLQNLAYLLGFFYEVTSELLFIPILGTLIMTLKCSDETISCFSGNIF